MPQNPSFLLDIKPREYIDFNGIVMKGNNYDVLVEMTLQDGRRITITDKSMFKGKVTRVVVAFKDENAVNEFLNQIVK